MDNRSNRKNMWFFLSVFLVIGISLTDFWWVLIPLISLVTFFWLIGKSSTGRSYGLLHSFKVIVFIVIALSSIKIFLIGIFNIPSISMSGTIEPGDRVVVCKWLIGPKFPANTKDIPVIHSLFSLFGINDKQFTGQFRMRGTSRIRCGDILVFRSDRNEDIFLVKRCLGLPGALVFEKDGQLILSGERKITKSHRVDKVIPYKGLTVLLTSENVRFYKNMIKKEVGDRFEDGDDKLYIDGWKITSYTFKTNYYYLMGDNRNYSQDSRHWGLLPEYRIEGKTPMILFAYHNGIVWNRLFKTLR